MIGNFIGAILVAMNWYDRFVDRLAASYTKRAAGHASISFFAAGVMLTIVISEGPTNPQFPGYHLLQAAKFWIACVAALVIVLDLILISVVYRRVLRRESGRGLKA
jgi:hypothetical protein